MVVSLFLFIMSILPFSRRFLAKLKLKDIDYNIFNLPRQVLFFKLFSENIIKTILTIHYSHIFVRKYDNFTKVNLPLVWY